MILEHLGKRPRIGRDVQIAPNAVICGDVDIGDGTAVLFGAVITAEGGPIRVGRGCVIMENAVLRATAHHPLDIGDHVMVGPHAYASGCAVAENVFMAAGSRVFNGARLGAGAEVRINAVVHIRTAIEPKSVVPIGWIAVGDPAKILPPDQHDAIWSVQRTLDFPKYVFGLDRPRDDGSIMPAAMSRYARALARHRDDRALS